jgi:protocatechuate 3,4-dioxygenase beta subunit
MHLRRRVVLGILLAALVAGGLGAWLAGRRAGEVAAPVVPTSAVASTTPVDDPKTAAQETPTLRVQPPPQAPAPVAPSVTSAPAAGEVVGVVEDARGRPVAYATIVALTPRAPTIPLDVLALIRDAAFGRPAAGSATSSRDGRFSIAGLPPGSYPIVARREGRVAASATAVVGDAAPKPLRLVLGDGHRVEGKVVRKDRTPVAGAAVVGFAITNALEICPPNMPTARTDETGAFAFDALAAGSWSFFAVPSNEGCSGDARAEVPAEAPIVLTLDGDGALSGRVTDETGAPVAGAQVVAAFAAMLGIDIRNAAAATTDADGRYELRGLAKASVEFLVAWAPGYAPYRGRVDQGDEPRRHDVKLSRGGVLRGTVVERGTKALVAGAMISVVGPSMLGGGSSATSGADGRFEIAGVALGRSVLVVTSSGRRQADLESSLSFLESLAREPRDAKPTEERDAGAGPVIFVAAAGDVVERSIEMFRPAVVKGRVLAPDGRPFPAATVVACGQGEERRGRIALLGKWLDPEGSGRAPDADGRFEILSPVASGRIVVEASAIDTKLRTSVVIDVAEGVAPKEIELRLGTGASIVGRVTDATTGEPVEGVWIGWWTQERSERDMDLRDDMGIADSAADGGYRFDLVPPGAVRMELRGRSGADRWKYLWVKRIVTVDAGKVTRADFAIERAHVIRGRVLFTDGRPVPEASLDFHPLDPQPDEAANDPAESYAKGNADGSFEVGGLRAGRYQLVASINDETRSDPVVASAGSTNVEIRLAPPRAIAGFVRFKDGAPVVGVEVSPWPDEATSKGRGFQMRAARTGADGSFRFDDMPDGTYNLVVGADRSPGLNVRFARLSGVKAGTTDLVITLERGLSITGRIVGPDGAAPADATVSCFPMNPADPDEPLNWGGAEVHDGGFEVLGLAPGKHWLVASGAGCVDARLVVEAGARDVSIRLAKGATVKGRVLLPDGKPAKRAQVWIRDSESEGSTSADTFAADDGTFELSGVGPGLHRVRAAEDLPFDEHDAKRQPCVGEVGGVRIAEGIAVDGIEIRLAKPAAAK